MNFGCSLLLPGNNIPQVLFHLLYIKLVKAVAQAAGGNGGGKPDLAMAGAKNPEKIDDALAVVKETVFGMLKA